MDKKFVVKYMVNNQFIGYHLSTFCQLTSNKNHAKIYSCDPPDKQLKIISKNLKFVLNSAVEKNPEISLGGLLTLLGGMSNSKYFKGLKFEDIILDYEYLD